MLSEAGLWTLFWKTVGVTGGLIFFGRFYLQWYASERQKRSVMPVGFWYMSGIGALMLFPYAVFHLQSPVGALSYSFNIVVYTRNLVHIWREKGVLSRERSFAAHGIAGAVCLVAFALVAYTWFNEYHATHPDEAVRTWLLIAIGTAGQGLFACRFFLQWVVTEAKRKSVVPVIFWHISVAASVLQIISYAPRGEWVFALGLIATLPVYLRNLWLIHMRRAPAPAPE